MREIDVTGCYPNPPRGNSYRRLVSNRLFNPLSVFFYELEDHIVQQTQDTLGV